MSIDSSIISQLELNSKSLFAKLLAREDISVRFSLKAKTASFDLKNRILILPIYLNLTKPITDTFVIHEIAHALFTPQNLFANETIVRVTGGNLWRQKRAMRVLNILEDARIEKMVRRRYPGTWSTFRAGYQALVSGNEFFGPVPEWSGYSFLNRLNTATKLFPLEVVPETAIPFSDEEREHVKAALAAETFEDVLKLATLLLIEKTPEGSKEKQKTESNSKIENDSLSDSSDSTEVEETPEETEDNSVVEEPGETEDGEEETPEDSKEPSETTGEPEDSEDEEETPEDDFDLAEHQSLFQSQHTSEDNGSISYIDLNKLNSDDVIVPHGTFWNLFDIQYSPSIHAFDRKFFLNSYREMSKKTITKYVSEFSRWKSAKEFAGSRITRTGDLDTSKLALASVSDDIFLRKTITFTAKNHGLVLYIDWSGSMGLGRTSTTIEDTLRQALLLCDFCRACSLPFEVYLFSNGYKDTIRSMSKEDYPYPQYDPFNLLQILTDTMTTQEYEEAASKLLEVGRCFSNHLNCLTNPHKEGTPGYDSYIPQKGYASASSICRLGMTPTIGTLCYTPHLLERFRTRTKVEKISVILLTDGEPSDEPNSSVLTYRGSSKTITGKYKALSDVCEFVSDVSNVNLIGIYVSSNRGHRILNSLSYRSSSSKQRVFGKELRKKMKESGFEILEIPGFSTFFVVPSSSLKVDLERFGSKVGKRMKKDKIAELFAKTSQSSKFSTLFIGNLMEEIGVGR